MFKKVFVQLKILIFRLNDICYFLIEMQLFFKQEDLSVVWESGGKLTKRLFSYCNNREDIENAIFQGP